MKNPRLKYSRFWQKSQAAQNVDLVQKKSILLEDAQRLRAQRLKHTALGGHSPHAEGSPRPLGGTSPHSLYAGGARRKAHPEKKGASAIRRAVVPLTGRAIRRNLKWGVPPHTPRRSRLRRNHNGALPQTPTPFLKNPNCSLYHVKSVTSRSECSRKQND